MITRGVSLGTGEITATNENIPHKLSILSTISWLEPSLPMYTKALVYSGGYTGQCEPGSRRVHILSDHLEGHVT